MMDKRYAVIMLLISVLICAMTPGVVSEAKENAAELTIVIPIHGTVYLAEEQDKEQDPADDSHSNDYSSDRKPAPVTSDTYEPEMLILYMFVSLLMVFLLCFDYISTKKESSLRIR